MSEKEIQIVSDGSCDLNEKEIIDNNVIVVPFSVSFDGVNYKKEIIEVGVREFYQQMVDHPGVYPKTSLPSPEDYLKVFKRVAEEGKDIICICITTKFSGSYNSALTASSICKTKYPDTRITIIDATVNTCLQGLLVKETCRMYQNGLEYDAIVENIERIKQTGRIFFTVGNLDYLRHGGRIGKLLGLVGATLRIKPMIVLKEGEIFSCGISLSRKKSMIRLIQLIKKHFAEINEKPEDYRFVVGIGYDESEGEHLVKKIQEEYPTVQIEISQIGATIGVHTGPYPIGIGLIRQYDK